MLQHRYKSCGADKTLFVKTNGENVNIAQIYVNDIVFGSTMQTNTEELMAIMKEFEMSIVALLTYFQGLQVKQSTYGFFLYHK